MARRLWPEIFSYVWIPASILDAGMMARNSHFAFWLAADLDAPWLMAVAVICFLLMVLQIFKIGCYVQGDLFRPWVYFGVRNCRVVWCFLVSVSGAISWDKLGGIPMTLIGIFYSDILLAAELCAGREFPDYCRQQNVIYSLEFLISRDPISEAVVNTNVAKRWAEWLCSVMRASPLRADTGRIALVDDDNDGRVASLRTPSSTLPAQFLSSVLNWSSDAQGGRTRKALWCIVNNDDSTEVVAQQLCHFLSSSGPEHIALADIRKTRSILWPLIRALAVASRLYRHEYSVNTPPAFEVYFRIRPTKRVDPWAYYTDMTDAVENLFSLPLGRIQRRLRGSNPGLVDESVKAIPRVTIMIHGVSDPQHTDEIMSVLRELDSCLPGQSRFLDLIIMCHSRHFRLAARTQDLMQYGHTLHLLGSNLDSGAILYSGIPEMAPPLCQNVFSLLLDGLYRTGGSQAQTIMSELATLDRSGPNIEISSSGLVQYSTADLFLFLHSAVEDRQRLLKWLKDISVLQEPEVDECIGEDNVLIARILQAIFEADVYKQDIASTPEAHVKATMNATHEILDQGLPDNLVILNWKGFTRDAQRLLNFLSISMNLLPNDLLLADIALSDTHPVKLGGYSNIYRGVSSDGTGDKVEVALKVLRIFQSPKDDSLVPRTKFLKEALRWRYLKHVNVVRLLGIDATIFPYPAMAMVTRWMPNGTVIDFVCENSPAAPLVPQLLRDTLFGLKYLHSANIVHGDLKAANILVDDGGVACLTDFGLTGFIESETTAASSTRGGTLRWMAPELILPPPGQPFKRTVQSDVWAWGCVCCEVWTEGEQPFSDLVSDIEILFAVELRQAIPYRKIPVDTGGNQMPDAMWKTVQLCWKVASTDRPSLELIEKTQM